MKIYATTVTTKGQITIPKKIREAKNIKPNERIIFSIKNGEVVLTKLLSMDEIAGSLHNPKVKPISDTQIKKIRESGAITKSKI